MIEKNFKTPSEATSMYCKSQLGVDLAGEFTYNFCASDDCMMWRWVSNEKGYCGLAGKPEA